ncbi:MAG TPA: autotransporter outer membrane beta-barrel domain-containing protein [Sphingobium sp.]|nr:autotransporter outer membrane beta-barrel domain-containing protein [Sphingobium sp.]
MSIIRFGADRLMHGTFAILAPVFALMVAQPAAAASYGSYAETAGQAAVGATFDNAAAAPSGDRAAMLASIDQLPTAADRADALGQLSPRAYAVLPRLAITSMDSYDQEIRDYLAERRSIAADAPAGVPTHGDRTFNMMLSGGLKQASFDAAPDRPAANMDGRSVRFAVDVRPVDNLIIGATLGVDNLDASLDLAQHPRITLLTTYIGPYASFNNGKFYLDVTAGYNLAEYKLRRQVQWAGFDDKLSGSLVEGDGWAATGEAGAMIRTGGLRIQPFAGLQYRYADMAGFSEAGGPAALDVAPFNTKSLRSSVGMRLSANMAAGKWTLRPTVEGRWQHELRKRTDSRIEARAATRDLEIFTLQPAGFARDVAEVGAGLTATYNHRTSVRLSYHGEYASDRHVNAARLTISRRF